MMIARGFLVAAALAFGAANDSFLIRNATVHPVTGAKLDNASVLVVDGKIAEVTAGKLTPPKGIRIVDGKGLHVYPGMIDSATEVGMSEIGSVRESGDTGELGDFNPQLRSSIAVNPSSEHIPVTRANGITAVIVLPGGSSENRGFAFGSLNPIITGQSALMHLDGWTWEEMELKRNAAIQLKFPAIQTMSARAMMMDLPASFPRASFADAKRSFDRRVAEMHEFFEKARRYQKGKASKEPGLRVDLKFEAMIPVLEGKTPLMVVAAKSRTVRDAIEFADKEKIKIILAGLDELGDNGARIKERGIPVILGPTLELPGAEDDAYDAKATLPAEAFKAGIKFAFGSFNTQFSRNLPYQAATAVAFGLPYDEALKAVTINAAEIWGVADQVGSVEKGKWADLILTDNDPLETATQIKQMFIKGKSVDLTSKHTKLNEKYMGRQ